MLCREVLLCLLCAGPAFGVITGSPKGPAVCVFDQWDDRVLVLINPALGPNPQIKRLERTQARGEGAGDIILPSPLSVSGLYEYPSFKLIYSLGGWSPMDSYHFGGRDMRFLLREVWDPPVNGEIQPPGTDPALWPPGMALYDNGRLVRYLPPEEIYRKYREPECFEFRLGGVTYAWNFDEVAMTWIIKTGPRGPGVFHGMPPWYSETIRLDARSGGILSFRAVDWLMAASIVATSLLIGVFALLWRRSRKFRARNPG